MFGTIKAALASIAVSLKSSIPTVVAATTATVLLGGSVYYYTIKDGIYEKNKNNIRYVLENYISQISLNSITENGRDGYAYSTNLDGMTEKILKELEDEKNTLSSYTGRYKEEEILKKLIKAELITQYPDLRNEKEIKKDKDVPENEVQGGIKIVKNSKDAIKTDDILKYDIEKAEVLSYKPYTEFKELIKNNNMDAEKYFSIKPSTISSSTKGNFIIKTDSSNAAPEVSREEIEKIIEERYTGEAQTNLKSVVDALLKIQDEYKVNPIFAIAVTQVESSCGTAWDLIDKSTYNWISIKKNDGGWMQYDSFSDATIQFASLISGSSYFGDNLISVSDIAPRYCDEKWGNTVNEFMAEMYQIIGKGNSSNITENTSTNENATSIDIVVASSTKVTTTVETVQHIPKDDGSGDETVKDKTSETQYSLRESSITYQGGLSKYSMPAGFLWSLLVMGENANFVSELADLAIKETKIIIEAQDNTSKTVNVSKSSYTQQKNITKTVTTEDGTQQQENVTVTAKNPSTVTTTIETINNNTSLNLTYANTWVAIYNKSYEKKQEEEKNITEDDYEWTNLENEKGQTTNSISEDGNKDKEYKELRQRIIDEITTEKCKTILNNYLNKITKEHAIYYLFEQDTDKTVYNNCVDYIYNYIKGDFTEKFIENNITIKGSIKDRINYFWQNKTEEGKQFFETKEIDKDGLEKILYDTIKQLADNMSVIETAEKEVTEYKIENKNGNASVTTKLKTYTSAGENVQERTDVDKKHNFVTYFNKSGRAKEYILQTPDWVYEMLESQEKTANMIDLFKYLLYKATGNSYGITTFDFEPIAGFISTATATSPLQQYLRFMHSWEGEPPAEGDNYIVFDDGYGNLTIGWGICFYSKQDGYMKKEAFKKIGYDVTKLKVGDKIPKVDIDNIESQIVNNNIERVESITTGLELTQYQKYALVDRMYQNGNINGFVDAYNQYWKDTDDAFKKDTSSEKYTHGLAQWFMGSTTGGVNNRRKAEWLLFKYGYYNRINEYYSSQNYNSDFYYGINLYNTDGSVSELGIKQLEDYLTLNVLHTTIHKGNGANQNGPFEKWWTGPINNLQKFQCTWWANGRASQYLELINSKYTEYPTEWGNGGEYFEVNKKNGWFNYGTTPKANSLITWKYGEYGHVGYVEAVDSNGDIYVSEAGSGLSWLGIRKYTKSDNYSFFGYGVCDGFIYLDEPN